MNLAKKLSEVRAEWLINGCRVIEKDNSTIISQLKTLENQLRLEYDSESGAQYRLIEVANKIKEIIEN